MMNSGGADAEDESTDGGGSDGGGSDGGGGSGGSGLSPSSFLAARLEGSGGRNGYSVSSAGDVDGDGRDDILIGAALANSFNGEVCLISGETLDLAADGTGVQTPGVIGLAVDLGL